MGRHITFWAIGDDIDQLLRLSEEKGLLATTRAVSHDEWEKGIKPSPPSEFADYPDTLCLFLPGTEISDLRYKRFEECYDSQSAGRSIEFSPSRIDEEGRLHWGRFYLFLPYEDDYDPALLRIFQNISRAVGKMWTRPTQYRAYMGPSAAALCAQGPITAVPW